MGKKKECPSCAMEVDSNNKKCPICGHDFEDFSPWLKWTAILLLVAIVAWLIL